MQPTAFRYTFPIAKAEQRADGLYIIGEASGPEVDAQNERMSPVAIERFAAQIGSMADSGFPLTYRDAHAADGVLRDLGHITRAWIDERFHLGIEVKLDEDSPSALYLFRQVQKGKQFGMSIAGQVFDYVDEFATEVGRTVRTYKDVVLTEISNTTRPAWTPSLGTVLSKAIDEAAAASADRGDNPSMKTDAELAGEQTAAPADDTAKADEAEATEEATEKAADSTEDETVETEKSEETEDEAETAKSEDETAKDAEEADAATEKSADEAADEAATSEETEKSATEEDADDIEKAGRSISAANGKRLLALHAELTSLLQDAGALPTEDAPAKSDSTDDEMTLTKSLDLNKALEAKVTELEQALTEKTARITELENTPATTLPTLIERSDVDEAAEVLAKASPSERLRAGLSALHG